MIISRCHGLDLLHFSYYLIFTASSDVEDWYPRRRSKLAESVERLGSANELLIKHKTKQLYQAERRIVKTINCHMKLFLYCSCGNFHDDLIIASQNIFKKANIISIMFGCQKQFKLHKKLNNGYNINNVMTND